MVKNLVFVSLPVSCHEPLWGGWHIKKWVNKYMHDTEEAGWVIIYSFILTKEKSHNWKN